MILSGKEHDVLAGGESSQSGVSHIEHYNTVSALSGRRRSKSHLSQPITRQKEERRREKKREKRRFPFRNWRARWRYLWEWDWTWRLEEVRHLVATETNLFTFPLKKKKKKKNARLPHSREGKKRTQTTLFLFPNFFFVVGRLIRERGWCHVASPGQIVV